MPGWFAQRICGATGFAPPQCCTDEVTQYAARALREGCCVDLVLEPHLFHAWPVFYRLGAPPRPSSVCVRAGFGLWPRRVCTARVRSPFDALATAPSRSTTHALSAAPDCSRMPHAHAPRHRKAFPSQPAHPPFPATAVPEAAKTVDALAEWGRRRLYAAPPAAVEPAAKPVAAEAGARRGGKGGRERRRG